MDVKRITELAEDYSRKRMAFEALGLRNTCGIGVEEQVKLDIAYAKAEAEKNLAWRLLEEAKHC